MKEQQQTDIIIPLLSPVRIILISIFDLYATLLIGLDYHPALSQCERSYKAGQRLAGKKFARPPPIKTDSVERGIPTAEQLSSPGRRAWEGRESHPHRGNTVIIASGSINLVHLAFPLMLNWSSFEWSMDSLKGITRG